MANYFKLAYPDIPFRAISITAASDADYPKENLIYGGSNLLWQAASSGTSSTITFDMGVGKTAPAEYCLLRGIHHLASAAGGEAEVDVEVRASTDNFSASNVLIDSVSGITLTGPKSEDVLLTFDTTTAYRYWRVVLTTSSSCLHKLRKIMLGRWFTFGSTDPFYPYAPSYIDGPKPFVSDNTQLFRSTIHEKRRMYIFRWRNVSDSVRVDFESKIAAISDDAPIALYYNSTGGHDPLSGAGIIMGWVQGSPSIGTGEANKDLNNIELTLIEDAI